MEFSRRMNTKYLVVVSALAVVLVAATALSTTDSAFAGKKRYEKSQATAQVNDCGNGEAEGTGSTVPTGGAIDVFCQNLASQIQGEDNSAALIGEQS